MRAWTGPFSVCFPLPPASLGEPEIVAWILLLSLFSGARKRCEPPFASFLFHSSESGPAKKPPPFPLFFVEPCVGSLSFFPFFLSGAQGQQLFWNCGNKWWVFFSFPPPPFHDARHRAGACERVPTLRDPGFFFSFFFLAPSGVAFQRRSRSLFPPSPSALARPIVFFRDLRRGMTPAYFPFFPWRWREATRKAPVFPFFFFLRSMDFGVMSSSFEKILSYFFLPRGDGMKIGELPPPFFRLRCPRTCHFLLLFSFSLPLFVVGELRWRAESIFFSFFFFFSVRRGQHGTQLRRGVDEGHLFFFSPLL